MSKQPLQTDCFEDAFLDYLELRWEFEPMHHYVLAAVTVCNQCDRPYPDFVKGWLDWFCHKVLFDEDIDHKGVDIPRGSLPTLSSNNNPLDAKWRRFEDCHDLLAGWLANNLKGALERQADRLDLIERVEQLRATETDEETYAQLEEWFGDEPAHTLRRKYKKIAKPKQYMSACIPIALVRRDGTYVIETRAAAVSAACR